MKKITKGIIIVLAILLAAFLSVFALAKMKVIFINEWFVNEKESTIGVDISHYQEDVDFQKLKDQDIAFVYMKATEGSSHQDDRFQEYWEAAHTADLPCGAYHFFSYDSPAQTQAENFISFAGPDLTGSLIPVVDVEYYGDKEENPPAKEDLVRELTIFLDALEAQYGVKPMIYTRTDLYKDFLKGEFDSYKIWMASFYKPLSWEYDGDWYLWQYHIRGQLEGYGGQKYIDLDVLNPDKALEDLICP